MMRTYHSPLYLLSKEQRDHLESLDFRQLRKELLLRLQLSGQTTMEINGVEYDHNRLIHTLEDLRQYGNYHLRLFRNQPLLAFVESGDIDFFSRPDSWAEVYDPEFQQWLDPFFTDRYAQVMYRCVSEAGFYSLNRLRVIASSEFKLPESYRDRCHQQALTFLQARAGEAEKQTTYELTERSGRLAIDDRCREYLTPFLKNVLKELPEDHHSAISAFGRYANLLLLATFGRESTLSKFEKPTLTTLSYAADIGVLAYKETRFQQLGEMIRDHLAQMMTDSKVKESTQYFLIGWKAIMLIFLFALLFHAVATSNRTFRSNAQSEKPAIIADLTERLSGRWHTILNPEGAPRFGHYYSFKEDSTGSSYYYFDQKEQTRPCQITITFNWEPLDGWRQVEGHYRLRLKFQDDQFTISDCHWKYLSEKQKQLFWRINGTNSYQNAPRTIKISTIQPDDLVKLLVIETFDDAPYVYRKVED